MRLPLKHNAQQWALLNQGIITMTTIKTENFTIDISDVKNSDDTRLFIEVEGLGFVTIVKTHEGLIIDVHNQTDSDSIASIGLENDDFMTSGELDAYEAFASEYEQLMLTFDKNFRADTVGLVDRAIQQNLKPWQAVELFYKENPVDIDSISGIHGVTRDFHTEVKSLTRPYLKITSTQYDQLVGMSFDFYLLGDSIVTFGAADGGYALMPVNEDRKAELLEAK